jgi:hypothetical protein
LASSVVTLIMSTKNKSVSFTKFERQLKIPFVIYVHFEAFRNFVNISMLWYLWFGDFVI